MDRIAKFEIVKTLGEGGMGIVYLARDETLQRELAVKVLRAEYLVDAKALSKVQGLPFTGTEIAQAVHRMRAGEPANLVGNRQSNGASQ